MDETPPGIRRVCIAIGYEYSAGNGDATGDFSGRLRAALIDACVASGLQRMLLAPQRDGDAQVALLPAGIDEPKVIAALTAELGAHLRRLNRHRHDSERLRVTMAVDEGITTLEAGGYRGHAIAKACRLVTSDPMRKALTAYRSADLIVLLSERIFDDISRLDAPGMRTGKCQLVEIDDPVDARRDVGWIYIP